MIVSMKKTVIAFLPEDLEKITESLQKCGEFMPISTETSDVVKTVSSPILDNEAEAALKAYKKYKKSGGMLTPPAEYTEEEFAKDSDTDAENVKKAVGLYESRESVKAQLKKNAEDAAGLAPFLSLEIPAEEVSGTKYTSLIIGRIPYSEKAKTAHPLDELCGKYGIEYSTFYESGGQRYFYASVFTDDMPAFRAELEGHGFEPVDLPYKTGTAAEALEKLNRSSEELEKQAEELDAALAGEAENMSSVELFYDREKAKADRAEVPADKTQSAVILTGWVRSDKTDEIVRAIEEVTGIYSVDFEDPGKDDKPPSVTKDPYLIDQCSVITDAFSPPGPDDIDPNPFMGPWYYMLFGMMIADVGYGALTAIMMFLYKKLKKPKGNTGKLVNVMLYASIPAVFWGVMYGSYFGQTWHPVLFSPLDNIMSALILSMVVGVLHMFTGMGIKAYQNIKAKKVIAAIADQFSWMLIITGIGLLFIEKIRTAAIVIACVGAGLLIIFGGYAKKSVIGKMTGGIASLYGITGYLSDVLSYLRIFALALASGLIGMVMNTIAGMLTGAIPIPVINVIVALPIYLLGHGINIALSLLSAYVHAGRLQYIEFFGKFYEGGGIKFTPIRRNNKYTTVVKEKIK